MNATETNVQFTLTSNISLQTATCVATVLAPDGTTKTSLPMIVGAVSYTNPVTSKVSPAYYWAYRSTLGTDFVQTGTYNVQLVATYPDSTVRIANAASVPIGKKL